MDSDRHEDSGEMYSPDDLGEYTLLDGAPRFSVQCAGRCWGRDG